jgi:hypothetical protein
MSIKDKLNKITDNNNKIKEVIKELEKFKNMIEKIILEIKEKIKRNEKN